MLPAGCSFSFLYHHRALDNPTEHWREAPINFQVKNQVSKSKQRRGKQEEFSTSGE